MLKFANYCIRIWNNQRSMKITRIKKINKLGKLYGLDVSPNSKNSELRLSVRIRKNFLIIQ